MKFFSSLALVAYAVAVLTGSVADVDAAGAVQTLRADERTVYEALDAVPTTSEIDNSMNEVPLVWRHTRDFALRHADSLEHVTAPRSADSVNQYGHKMPYDEELRLSFKSMDRSFDFRLHAYHDLHAPEFEWEHRFPATRADGSGIDVDDVDDADVWNTHRIERATPTVTSYVGRDEVTGCVAHVTVHSHTHVHASVAHCHDDRETMFTLDHLDHLDHHDFDRETARRQAAVPERRSGRNHIVSAVPMINFTARADALRARATRSSPLRRSLLEDRDGTGTRTQSKYERWTRCYKDVGKVGLNLSFGLAMDYGYTLEVAQKLGMSLEAHGQQTIHDANVIYASQFHVWLQLRDSTLMRAPGGVSWNKYTPGTNRCKGDHALGAAKITANVSLWKQKRKAGIVGTYHLLTHCNANGASGMSPIGHVCNDLTGVAWTSLTWSGFARLAKTFVHENGHNLGSNHPFGIPVLGVSLPKWMQKAVKLPKEGETGGVMDYGNTLWKGIFQFAQSSRKGICNNIQRDIDEMQRGRWRSRDTSCFTKHELLSSDRW